MQSEEAKEQSKQTPKPHLTVDISESAATAAIPTTRIPPKAVLDEISSLVIRGTLEELKTFVTEHNLDVEIVNDQALLLHITAQANDIAKLEYLLLADANPLTEDKSGKRPLDYAREHGEKEGKQAIELLETALAKKLIDVIQDGNGSKEGNVLLIARKIVSFKIKTINTRDKYGYTALHWAARHGYYEVVLCLVGGGADVNIQSNGNKTPLAVVPKGIQYEQLRKYLAGAVVLADYMKSVNNVAYTAAARFLNGASSAASMSSGASSSSVVSMSSGASMSSVDSSSSASAAPILPAALPVADATKAADPKDQNQQKRLVV